MRLVAMAFYIILDVFCCCFWLLSSWRMCWAYLLNYTLYVNWQRSQVVGFLFFLFFMAFRACLRCYQWNCDWCLAQAEENLPKQGFFLFFVFFCFVLRGLSNLWHRACAGARQILVKMIATHRYMPNDVFGHCSIFPTRQQFVALNSISGFLVF